MSDRRAVRSLALVLGILATTAGVPRNLCAEEYSFDLSEIEKKPYSFGGYAELRPVLSWLDRDAASYKLRFNDRDEGAALSEYSAALQLAGGYEHGPARAFVRVNTSHQDSALGTVTTVKAYEAFLSVRPAPSITVDAGKRPFKWGKGYAWNPVAFVDRPKNPDEPDLNLEGFVAASVDYIRSFSGPLKTLSVTPVLLPVSERVNDDFGEADHLNLAGKVYLLLYDTDIDILFLSGGSRTPRIGLDFSRNITTNLELHGEYARIEDFTQSVIDSDGNASRREYDATNWLLGLRYLTEKDTTYILEYYRNGTGFTERETRDYFTFVHDAYDSYRETGEDAPLQKASAITAAGYARPNAGRSYLFVRVSQKDPFGILYWLPAVTAIVNAEDTSYSVSPEVTYSGITNLEVRLKGTVLVGDRLSEFGEKQGDLRVELLVRYYL